MEKLRWTQVILMGNVRDKSPLGRPTRRLKYNIKIKLLEIRWERGLDLFGSG
jgi:hypothetical protein